jgi:hypothetical protein
MTQYEITLSGLLKLVVQDLCDGTDLASVRIRDIADRQMQFEGIKEAGSDMALKMVPQIWGAFARGAAEQLGKVTIPAED